MATFPNGNIHSTSSVDTYPLSSLNDYFNRIKDDGNISFDEEMSYEVRRFQSFNGCRILASPMRLARSGFYFTRNGDETQCFRCQKTHRNWKLMDKPDVIHRMISPYCSYLNGLKSIPEKENASAICGVVEAYSLVTDRHFGPTGSTPAAQATIVAPSPSETSLDISRAVYPQYRHLQRRLDSYQGWGWSHVQNPQILAGAGFHYAGYRDCVRCFYCGVGLRTWEKEDDPWVEHVRWRSSCDYIHYMKGEKFIIATLAAESEPMSGVVLPPVNSLTKDTQDNQQANAGVCGITARAEEMGFKREAIERAMEALIRFQDTRHGTKDTTIQNGIQLEELLEKLILEDQGHDQSSNADNAPRPSPTYQLTPTTTGVPSRLADNIARSHDGISRMKEILTEGVSCITRHDMKHLEEENQSMRDESSCKVCLDNLSCIVFLPCGHLVTCAECALALNKCPICRALIRGTVRVYNA